MSFIYVKPNLARYSKFDEISEASDLFMLSKNRFDFEGVYKEKLAFIIGDPGFGKSRLLKEIVSAAPEYNVEAAYIDLKKINNKTISNVLNEIDKVSDDTTSETNDNFKTNNFLLSNSNEVLICLDALDEVSSNDFFTVVENIYKFIDKYSKAKVFISCRTNYINHWKSLLTKKDFSYIQVMGFNSDQLYEFFNKLGYQEDLIKESKIYDNNLLRNPRYLEIYVSATDNKERERLLKLSKGDFFKEYLSRELKIESKKVKKSDLKEEIVIAFLQKLALTMEIYQTNVLMKEELMVFFDDIKSNLSNNFLNQINLSYLYERTLLKDNIDSIEFKNTELQEYLASGEILKLGRLDQVVFDLVIHDKLHEINPSWINTLGFLLETDLSLVRPILDLSLSDDSRAHAEDYYKLVPKYNTDQLSNTEKDYIFSKVFLYYQQVGHWIDYDVAERLSFYYSTKNFKIINQTTDSNGDITEQQKVAEANAATVIAYLAKRNLLNLSQSRQWIAKLLKYAMDKDRYEVIRRRAIFALGEIGRMDLLGRVAKSVFETSNDSIFSSLIYACEKVDINHSISIKCIAEGIKRNSVSARIALLQITKRDSLVQLLKIFLRDQNLLSQFLEHETIYDDDTHKVVKNIENVIDDKLINIMQKIVVKAFSEKYWFRSRESNFIVSITKLLKTKKQDYIFVLLDAVRRLPNQDNVLYALEEVFAHLLEVGQIETFTQKLNSDRHIIDILDKMLFFGDIRLKEIFRIANKMFPNEFKKLPSSAKKPEDRDIEKNKQVYSIFRVKLKPSPDKYDPSVFKYYLENKEIIKPILESKDKERLEELIIGSVFEKFDPGDHGVKITQRDSNSSSYTTSSMISIFGSAIKVAYDFGLSVKKYRQKILNYVPFSYDSHLEAIIGLIPSPTKGEFGKLLEVYTKKRDDDLVIHLPSSFIHFCEKIRFNEAKNVLKFYVEADKISVYDRSEALRVISDLGTTKTFLKSVFSKYKDKADLQDLSTKANEYLISNFEDADAIKWRFAQILTRAFPFKQREGVHTIGRGEQEIHSNDFSKPLMNLKSDKYKAQFENLLEKSFDILAQGDEYLEYTSYIWNIIIQYYKNLIEVDYNYIFDLNKLVLQYKGKDGMNWFTYRVHEIKQDFMIRLAKPKSIADCIKKYNDLKSKMYLDVRSDEDFVRKLIEIIDKDVRRWIESEGAYKFIMELSAKPNKTEAENLIQKTIETQFENCLIKKGFRAIDIKIDREKHLLDDKRTDFLVSYGFMGPILIEIKLTTNRELDGKKAPRFYRKKLLQYLAGSKSCYGIFLILQNDSKRILENYLPKLKELYARDNIEVIGLDCKVVDIMDTNDH